MFSLVFLRRTLNLLVFSQILLKFIVNKNEKLREIEQKKRANKLKEEANKRL